MRTNTAREADRPGSFCTGDVNQNHEKCEALAWTSQHAQVLSRTRHHPSTCCFVQYFDVLRLQSYYKFVNCSRGSYNSCGNPQ